MSDLDEITSSDESQSYGSIVSEDDEEVTVEDSDEAAQADDESIIGTVKRVSNKKKRRAVIDSDNELEEEEEEFETRALSPRTRMSITGIRPRDLTDDDSSEIEYSGNDADQDGGMAGRNEEKRNLSLFSEESEEEGEEEEVEQSQSKAGQSVSKSLSAQEDALKESYASAGSSVRAEEGSIVEDSTENTSADKSLTDNNQSKQESPKAVHKFINKSHLRHSSPGVPNRYSTHFESGIKDKLSSTVYQHRTQSPDTSDSSDLIIIEKKEKPIEISSSEDDSDNDVEETKNISNSTPKTQRPVMQGVNQNNNLVQPKISAAINKVPIQQNNQRTPKSSTVTYVSQAFYDKELKKIEDLKSEKLNAEKLLEKISKSLPDGGRQLSIRIERLGVEVAIKSKYLAGLRVEDVSSGRLQTATNISSNDKDSTSQKFVEIKEQRKASFNSNNNNAPDWDELSAAVNQIQPVHTGRQGMATFQNQKALTVERLKVNL